MADEGVKAIKARIKHMVEEAGVAKKLTAENEKVLDKLRARLKIVNSLNREERTGLESSYKLTKTLVN